MSLVLRNSEPHDLVRAVVQRALGATTDPALYRGVDFSIDARDEMYADALAKSRGDRDGALVSYFASGLEVACSIGQILDDLFPEGLTRALDFGCGYGRVTRFLAARFANTDPTPELWASDILSDALLFQEEHLGTRTFPSARRPRDLEIPSLGGPGPAEPLCFDLIYVGSLFTHLPESTFSAWLERLTGMLSERGILVFTVHDQSLMPPQHSMPASGLCFEAASESRTLDPNDYGSSWATPEFVERQIAALEGASSETPGWNSRRISRGLCGYQDLHLVTRRTVLGRLQYDGGAFVRIEQCEVGDDDLLSLTGWAVSRFSESEELRIEVDCHRSGDTTEVGRATPDQPRPDCFERLSDIGLTDDEIARGGLSPHRLLHSGWQCRCTLGSLGLSGSVDPVPSSDSSVESASETQLIISARTRRATRVIFAGTLDQLLFQTAEENFRRHYDRAYQLEEVITRMKQSRFWTLKTHWFTVKRALGLTRER